ncbi:DNA-binding transcriptional MerR regulator [Clostridium tetanomorphum]|uniref:MerR family transcriptional regulator n=1 Tax=Clostridium tetanomorphum TaxID=1553 RepID=UPI0004533550|nr:MerR family transcriptional regulator [Clostridium tetanomorphum]KAJ49030.1 transcriptional regulator [Clostridium tetanomorphum DSM 665]KAJ51722.1 transcriptional regulator [Clostridium tetanomorphum DSM 665]MBP1865912.1 DNA-binding transcriptional MerR regulator [Clostridium tetanomorphum]NRS86093.1 DNA-binding transcriptional MerR regulator [Clostridium tetanomorphum]SQB89681.1 transcriptional regulator [Clostridium tetanomorphum]
MEYTVQKLARIAGVSTRTLRYYDEIGILKPARINSSGYRIYGENEVNKLQQILFYKELGVNLESIKQIVTSPYFDRAKALKEHRHKLLEKRLQLDLLIENVDKTITTMEGRIIMSDKEKFEGFKQRLIENNEKKYGEEIRKKYGNEAINRSNKKLKNMTKEEYKKITKLEDEIMENLQLAFKTSNPSGELAQKVADLHRQWISFYWDSYSKETHAGIAQMYVDDERFKVYYNKKQPGMAEFLRDAIFVYTGIKK